MVKVGEVYSTSQNSDQLYVLQFVTRDTTQLNSDVVAIWKMSTETWQSYSCDTLPEPDLFLHTTVLAGIRQSLWHKIGNAEIVDFHKVKFKSDAQDSLDVDDSDERESRIWHVWKIGKKWKTVKKALFDDESIYPGAAFPPETVDYIVKHGHRALFDSGL